MKGRIFPACKTFIYEFFGSQREGHKLDIEMKTKVESNRLEENLRLMLTLADGVAEGLICLAAIINRSDKFSLVKQLKEIVAFMSSWLESVKVLCIRCLSRSRSTHTELK